MRHGGASHDRACGLRNATETMQRGAWRASSSVKRYEKSALLSKEWQKLTGPTRKRVADEGSQLLSYSNAHLERLFGMQGTVRTKLPSNSIVAVLQ